MPARNLMRCVLALTLAAPLGLQAQPFNAKPGTWELTTTAVTTGAFFPPEGSAEMTPAQRAQIEKHIQENSGKPATRVVRTCMTPERLDQDTMTAFKNSGPCKQKIIAKTAKKIVVERICPAPHAYTATWSAEAPTPETMKATNEVVLQNGGKMHVDITGKWLGAKCETVSGKK